MYASKVLGYVVSYEAPKDANTVTKGAYIVKTVVSVSFSRLANYFTTSAKDLYSALTTDRSGHFEFEYDGGEEFSVTPYYNGFMLSTEEDLDLEQEEGIIEVDLIGNEEIEGFVIEPTGNRFKALWSNAFLWLTGVSKLEAEATRLEAFYKED